MASNNEDNIRKRINVIKDDGNNNKHIKGDIDDNGTTNNSSIIKSLFPINDGDGFFLPLFPKYITKEGGKELKEFKYYGEDRSILYKYILSPLAEYLVNNYTCKYRIHPNILTISGLICTIIPHLIVLYYAPNMIEKCPSWVWLLTSIMIFINQTLDNMDGKQARKLGLSSPLGLVLDHGCDALNVVMTTFSVATLFQFGSTYKTLYVMLIGAVPFFFASWEEFYAGEFIMPQFNGPSEGIFILISVFLIGYIVNDYTIFYHNILYIPKISSLCCYGLLLLSSDGSSRWGLEDYIPSPSAAAAGGGGVNGDDHDGDYYKLEYCDIPLIGCTIFALIVIYTNVRNVIRHEKDKKIYYDNNNKELNRINYSGHHRNHNHHHLKHLKHYNGKRPRIRDALSCAFPFCLGGILSLLWVLWSYDNVMDKHPRLVIWMIGLIFSKLVTHIQLAHVCGERYTAWRKTYLIPLIIITCNCGIGYYFGYNGGSDGSPPIDESLLLICMTMIAIIGYFNMVYGVLTEMAEVLKCNIFTVPNQNNNNNKE